MAWYAMRVTFDHGTKQVASVSTEMDERALEAEKKRMADRMSTGGAETLSIDTADGWLVVRMSSVVGLEMIEVPAPPPPPG